VSDDYGLDDRAIGVRSPAVAEDFSLASCVQTGCGSHPASLSNGYRGPFPGGKVQPGRDVVIIINFIRTFLTGEVFLDRILRFF
jgi:hypothetical protein